MLAEEESESESPCRRLPQGSSASPNGQLIGYMPQRVIPFGTSRSPCPRGLFVLDLSLTLDLSGIDTSGRCFMALCSFSCRPAGFHSFQSSIPLAAAFWRHLGTFLSASECLRGWKTCKIVVLEYVHDGLLKKRHFEKQWPVETVDMIFRRLGLIGNHRLLNTMDFGVAMLAGLCPGRLWRLRHLMAVRHLMAGCRMCLSCLHAHRQNASGMMMLRGRCGGAPASVPG